VQGIDLGQQAHVLGRVASPEGLRRRPASILDTSRGHVLRDQARHLRARDAGDLAQVQPRQPLVGLTQARIAEPSELVGDEAVGRLTLRRGEIQRRTAGEEGTNLRKPLQALGLERHDHPPMIPAPARRLQAHFTLESRHPFRLICHWKRLLLALQRHRAYIRRAHRVAPANGGVVMAELQIAVRPAGCLRICALCLWVVALPAGAERSNADFVAACTSSSNLPQANCECAAGKAQAKMSADGFAFLVATLEGDQAASDALRAKLPLDQMMKAATFMTRGPAQCAREAAVQDGTQ
jgi:hypothetical protein